jgi:hypothetical protein
MVQPLPSGQVARSGFPGRPGCRAALARLRRRPPLGPASWSRASLAPAPCCWPGLCCLGGCRSWPFRLASTAARCRRSIRAAAGGCASQAVRSPASWLISGSPHNRRFSARGFPSCPHTLRLGPSCLSLPASVRGRHTPAPAPRRAWGMASRTGGVRLSRTPLMSARCRVVSTSVARVALRGLTSSTARAILTLSGAAMGQRPRSGLGGPIK